MQGIQHISARPLAQAVPIYCGQCGAIFGVVPKEPEKRGLLKNPPANIAKTAATPPAGGKTPSPGQSGPLTPEQSRAMLDYYYQHNRGTNRTRIARAEDEEAQQDDAK